MTKAQKLRRVQRLADRYHASMAKARKDRSALYQQLVEDTGEYTVREAAAVTRLSSGRVNQVQHGK